LVPIIEMKIGASAAQVADIHTQVRKGSAIAAKKKPALSEKRELRIPMRKKAHRSEVHQKAVADALSALKILLQGISKLESDLESLLE